MPKRNLSARSLIKPACVIILLITGCAAQPVATGWNEKDNVVTIHHLAGKTDTVETLTHDSVKNDALGEGKFYKVKTATIPLVLAKKEPPKSDSKADLAKKVARLTSRIEDLEDDLKNSKRKPESSEKKEPLESLDQHNATANPEPSPQPPPPTADTYTPRPSD